MRIITVNKNLEKLLGTKDNYFTIEAVTSGTVSISINERFEIELYCSVNDDDWELLKYNGENYTKKYNLNIGDKIHFKCDNKHTYFTTSTIQKNFKFNAMGFLSSLWKGDNCISDNNFINNVRVPFSGTEIVDASKLILPNDVYMYCYEEMFKGCTSLTKAPKLPAMTLAESCYYNMFNGCTSLNKAPELPATTLANTCYKAMFLGCTSLTTAPKLPAMTLAESCYSNMFSGCTSLTTAPELPATTLVQSCYQYMFNGCSSLTSAPELPATTLANTCYSNMFRSCTSLTTAPALPATMLANGCYQSMFNGCKSLTTGLELPATTLANGCYQSMVSNCTSLTSAPELPAITLANNCYESMFSGCKSLTSAPELPATTLVNGCYNTMFNGCTSLNYIKAMFTTKPSSTYTASWVGNVASTGTFVKNAAATWDVSGSHGVPTGWTVETVSA